MTVNSGTQITATSPPGSGAVPVTVISSVGPSPAVTASVFTYLPVPTVTAISPASGPATRGTIVTITGSGFSGGTVSVQFGTTPAPAVTVNSATQITATSPPGSGTASVTVSNLSGTSAAGTTDRFGYLPAVTGISPASGPVTGATPVTITGAGFTGATSVRFGTTGAALTVNSDTQIAATSPPGPVRARPASP